ncbi:UNVERIFIED_CONTAM: hypothetical protein Slati_2551900 [Sesamum latifolium]|uniref:Uncharacterized protein n=1 Tax=Sesamum latifolium TaxID=2727402 RepID=A0AAW2VWF2_9LAMI
MNLAELLAIFGPALPARYSVPAGGFGWTPSSAAPSKSHSKEDIDYSPYEDGEWRLKLWLFIAYVVSFVSLAASVGLLIQDALVKSGPSAWTGVAGVLQCVFVLIRLFMKDCEDNVLIPSLGSGLIYWISHSE